MVPPTRLDPADFERLSEAIAAYCGIRMPADMRILIQAHLSRRAQAMGVADVHEYCRLLAASPRSREWESELVDLIDRMTSNLDVD